MVSLTDALLVLFPTATPLVDYAVDAELGITRWNLIQAQPTPVELAAVTAEQVALARVSKILTAAGAILSHSAESDHVAIRAADATEWTYGRNDVAECLWAALQLVCARAGVDVPATGEIAAQVAANRLVAPVDPAAPAPAGVADRGKRRLTTNEILSLIGGVLQAGGGLPTG